MRDAIRKRQSDSIKKTKKTQDKVDKQLQRPKKKNCRTRGRQAAATANNCGGLLENTTGNSRGEVSRQCKTKKKYQDKVDKQLQRQKTVVQGFIELGWARLRPVHQRRAAPGSSRKIFLCKYVCICICIYIFLCVYIYAVNVDSYIYANRHICTCSFHYILLICNLNKYMYV